MGFEVFDKRKAVVRPHRPDQVSLIWRNGPSRKGLPALPWAHLRIGFGVADEAGWNLRHMAQVLWGTDDDLGVVMIDCVEPGEDAHAVTRFRPNKGEDYVDVTITPAPDWLVPHVYDHADLTFEMVDDALFVRLVDRSAAVDQVPA